MKQIVKLLQKFLSPVPMVMVLSFLAAAVLWVFGSKLKFGQIAPFADPSVKFWVVVCLLALGGFIALYLIVSGLIAWRKSKSASPKREPTEEELESVAMDDVFQIARKVIKERWEGNGNRVYALPWYLVLGQEGAGKTALIDNADLRFPIDHEIKAEMREIGYRKAAEFVTWRIAGNEAVMLEIDGKALIPHEARSEVQMVLWRKLITNLRKTRPRRPINGIILVLDLPEFSKKTLAEREEFSAMLRKTMTDLVDQLGTKLTVHVILNKLDQIAGFRDFFDNLSASERESLFGFHFLFEGKHTPPWLEQFDIQFGAFLERIHAQTTKRLADLKTSQSRHEAFSFYRTFIGLQTSLRSFLEGALSPDKFSMPPLVRAVYMSSARQENAPSNVFMDAVGQRYHLPSPLYPAPQGASFPYFATKLFRTAIFPEAGLAGNNRRVEGRYRRSAQLLAGLGVAVSAAGGFYWNHQYQTNLARGEAVLELSDEFARLANEGQADPTGQKLLGPLNVIGQATESFGDYRTANPVAAQLTLYQGGTIGPITDRSYSAMLNKKFMPALIDGVADELRQVCPRGSNKQLGLLSVYRMLGVYDETREGKNQKIRDDSIIEKYYRTLWQQNFPADAATQDALATHLTYALKNVPQAYDLDDNLVLSSQEELRQLTPYQRVYATMRSLADRQLPNNLEFRSAVGAVFDVVYEPNSAGDIESEGIAQGDTCGLVTEKVFARDPFSIPRLFTKEQFKKFFIPQVGKVSEVAAADLWVLGVLESTKYSEADYALISSKLREIYVDEYIRVWRQSLNAMSVRPFTDLRDASEILRGLSGGDNPIRRIAALTRDNTVIYQPQAEEIASGIGEAGEIAFDPDRAAGLRINEAFREIHAMLEGEPSTTQPNIDQIQEALAAVYDYIKTVRDAPDPNAKALEFAIARAKLTGDDPIYILQQIAERTPAPFGDHLKHVATESWRVVMEAATAELNRKWNAEIYGAYLRLIEGKYPFERSSQTDVPLADFQEFFKPDGILEKFYLNELLTFVNESTGKPRIIDGQTLDVDENFARDLRSAIEITRIFFNQAGDLAVEFQVQPIGMNANLSRAILNFEGQQIISAHRASRPVSIIWPNIIDGPRSSRFDLSPLSNSGAGASQQYEGPWSWLRLYDDAAKSSLAGNAVDIGFANTNGQAASFRIRAEGRVNPFFNSPLSAFDLPQYIKAPQEEGQGS